MIDIRTQLTGHTYDQLQRLLIEDEILKDLSEDDAIHMLLSGIIHHRYRLILARNRLRKALGMTEHT